MFDEGDFEEVYDGEARSGLVDNDQLTAQEEAFMQGYDEDQRITDLQAVGDKAYEDAFEKKSRRSKRKQRAFDEAELEAEVLMR